jgi:hypothetical protein
MSLLPLGLLSQGGGAGGAADYELISSQLLGSDTASVTFSSIPQTFKHLQLRYVTRSTNVAGASSISPRANGDSASNYSTHGLNGNGSAASSFNIASWSSLGYIQINGSDVSSSIFAHGIFDLLDYTNTNKFKTARTLSGYHNGGSDRNTRLASGHWRNTNAVTSLTLSDAGGNFAAGSRFSLYGIKG